MVRFMTTKQYAEQHHVHIATVRARIARGELGDVWKINGKFLIPIEEKVEGPKMRRFKNS